MDVPHIRESDRRPREHVSGVDVPEPPHEQETEATEGDRPVPDGRSLDAEGGQLAEEVSSPEPEDPRRDDSSARLLGRTDVTGEDAHVQRGRVSPQIATGVITHHLV